MNKKKWQEKGKGHRQRLRDRFLDKGIDSFSDAELIELLLSFGTPRSDCKEAAKKALEEFGSLPAVLDAPSHKLQEIEGLGPKNIFALHFIQGAARRYLKQRLTGKTYINSSKEVADYLIYTMRGLQREVLSVVFLDASYAVITSEIVAEGTISVNTIYPRELIKKALDFNASAIVIAHNHPSGKLQPSSQDKDLTKSLYLICSFMHIKLLDHLIIGDGDAVFSFADHGLMKDIKLQCSKILTKNS